MRALLSALLLTSALACGNSKPPAEPNDDEPRPKVVANNSEFTLRRGERASIDGGRLLVTFLAVASDSRCPTDVVCVWQGDAAMLFHLESARAEAPTIVDTLHTELQPRSANYFGLTVTVKNLLPYPHTGQEPGARDYRVSLTVRKNDG